MAATRQRETGKQRSSRIDLDYFKGRDALGRARLWLTLLAVVGAVAYLASGFTGTGNLRYSHGPLSEAHAAWETQCSSCHEPFVAIRRDAWLARPQTQAILDKKCTTCHAGPPHHDELDARTDLAAALAAGCSGCHREHRGRQASLTRVADALCTSCHGDLNRLRDQPSSAAGPQIAARITEFGAQGHPQFRSLGHDPGTVKFNHRLHLTAGLTGRQGDRGPLRWEDLPADYVRQQGRQPTDQGEVQLDCSSCHRLEGGGDFSSRPQAPPAGRYMAPVIYENHCQTCHPLDYEPGVPERTVPHGRSFAELRRLLAADYARGIVEQERFEVAVDRLQRPIPGKHSPPQDAAWVASQELVNNQVQRALLLLQEVRCAKCHDLAGGSGAGGLPRVPAANINSRWFVHARFSHLAHRSMTCRDCHPQAYSDSSPGDAPDHETVMILGRDHCLSCHHNSSTGGAGATARSDCIECHRYHVGPDPELERFLTGHAFRELSE